MATRTKTKGELRGKARLRAEIVEISRGLNKIGAISDAELEKTTLRMLGRDALPKVATLSPAEIAGVRARAGVSQAVMAVGAFAVPARAAAPEASPVTPALVAAAKKEGRVGWYAAMDLPVAERM